MNASDYGGGIPVVDVWRKDGGMAVGHVEKSPKLVLLPVDMKLDSNGVQISVRYSKDLILKPDQVLNTFQTFVSVHHHDFYHSLEQYGKYMRKQGIMVP